ncbi:MAG: hypothetical protein IPJ84_19740 [Bdellovibrionales bacterium]|nr:hypothetical protein [Bdellovibrionales bacterium]
MSLIIVDQFSKTSSKLRGHFEKITKDDHSPDRFVWDFWNKPGRYVHLRTPAVRFFPEPLFKKLKVSSSRLERSTSDAAHSRHCG